MQKRMTTALRLTLGFGLFFVMLVVSVLLGLNRLHAVDAMIERIVTREWQKTVLANDAVDLMNANARETYLLFHVQDRGPVRQRIAENVQKITAKLAELDKLLYKPEGKAALVDISEKRKIYVASFSGVAKLLELGKEAEAVRQMTAETVPALDTLLAPVDKLIKVQGRILEDTRVESHAAYGVARNTLILFLVVAAVAAFVVATWIIRAVTRPLGGEPDEAKAVVGRIAQGDLTAEIMLNPGDEDSLLAATKRMQANLRRISESCRPMPTA